MRIDVNKWSSILFWWVGLPSLGIVSGWFYLHHKSPLDQIELVVAFVFCLPYLYFKTTTKHNMSSARMINELRKMTALEFAEAETRIASMSRGMLRSMMQEAYQSVYRERFLGKSYEDEQNR